MHHIFYRYLLLILLFPLLGEALPFQEGENRVGLVKIERERPIDQSTFLYVKFALDHFEKEGCSSVILELDTPGGEVFAAQKISTLLKRSKIPVVAYINNWAISAGAMLAYSCPYIVTTKSSSMGAAEPVMMKGQAMESAPEKIRSALRAEFANLAEFYGRNPDIAKAMVDQDILLVKRGEEVLSLSSEEKVREGDEIYSSFGKLLTLDSKALSELKLSDRLTEDLFQEIFGLTLVEYRNWKVDFFSFLSHPFVAALLSMGLMLGLYLEMQMGGFGLPALLALTSLGLMLLSHFAVAATDFLEPIFLLTGLSLILLEIFLVPTYGFLGAVGAILFMIGLFTMGNFPWREVSFSSWNFEGWNLSAFSLIEALGWFSFSLLASLFCMFFFSRILFPKTALFKKIIPDSFLEKPPVGPFPSIGSLGTAFSVLKPQGMVEVDGEIFEAKSIEGFIDKGQTVMIISHESDRVLIRPKRVL